jgi:hypothetical protein
MFHDGFEADGWKLTANGFLGPRSARFSARREWRSTIKFDRNVQTFGEQAN